MAPKKLSDSDRKDILTRYRLPEETTVTIANHYGVSTSTISRILKQHLSETEYDALIQQKRSGAHRGQPDSVESPVELPESVELPEPVELPEEVVTEVASPVPLTRDTPSPAPPKLVIKDKPHRVDRTIAEPARFDTAPSPDTVPALPERPRRQRSAVYSLNGETNEPAQLELDTLIQSLDYRPEDRELKEIQAEFGGVEPVQLSAPSDLADEDLDDDLDEDLDEDLDDDLDEDLDDEDLDDDLDLADETSPFTAVQITDSERLRVLPLSEAHIPRTCYVVVDRSAELITRPLRDFAVLGQIPEDEIQARTLPIFDNHRVAKRFMRRMQRVVKVPDGRVFQKVKPYLQAKGITRLLIGGQVYSL
ncbi:MAG TPA: helix-turn-helix domain-containing protein [Allocoleopsis sp.]